MRKRIIALLLALILTVGLLPTVALAATTETSVSKTEETHQDNLNLVKTVTEDGDNYKVKLEAWATGKTVIDETKIPLDIVLVLDESGSMEEDFTTTESTQYELHRDKRNKKYKDWADSGNLFFKDINGNFYQVTVTVNGKEYVYTYKNSAGQDVLIGRSSGKYKKPSLNLYRKYTTTTVSKNKALKDAANSFINAVYGEAVQYKLDHRIAVVTYSYNAQIRSGNKQANGAFVTVNTAENKNSLTGVINGLQANGSTYIDEGIQTANSIFNANQFEAGTRARVMIVFTDGGPGQNGEWDAYGDSHSTANSAISYAKTAIEKHKAAVYTIGIFDGAAIGNPATLPTYYPELNDWSGDSNKAKASNSNRFMHLVSSNYPGATSMTVTGSINENLGENKSFYLAASSAGALSDVFETINEEISTDTTTLGEEALIIDKIPGNFAIPANAQGITLTVANYKADGSFEAATTAPAGVTAKYKNNTVTVTGFDFSDNWCGVDQDGKAHGQKLIIEFTIKHNNYGGTQPTNDGAGIADKDGLEIIKVSDPEVLVKISAPADIFAQETEKPYDGTGFDILGNVASKANSLADGTKNKFVDIEVKVTVGGTDYTYKIKAGQTTGTWSAATRPTTSADVKDDNKDGVTEAYEYPVTITFKDAAKGSNASNSTNTNAKFKINYAEAKVTANNKSKKATEPDPDFDATVEGMVNGEDAAQKLTYTISRTDADNNTVGDHTTITPAGKPYQNNYKVTYETGTLTITEGDPTETEFSLTGKFQKTLNSNTADVPSKSFELTITGTSDNTGKTTISGTADIGTLAKQGDKYTGSAYFGFSSALKFSTDGTYKYKVQETKGNVAGMSYDTTEYELVIEVENKNGALEIKSATIGSTDMKNGGPLTITNPVTAAELPLDPTTDPTTGEVTPKIVKKLRVTSGSAAPTADLPFTVAVYEGNAVDEAKRVATGTATIPANSPDETTVNFTGLATLVFPEAGRFTYTIHEDTGSTSGVRYDGYLYTMTVEVTKNTSDNSLSATCSFTYPLGEETVVANSITITNTYTEPKEPRVVSKRVVTTDVHFPDGLGLAIYEFESAKTATVLYPTGDGTTNNTLEVPYGTDSVTLLYAITVNKGTTSNEIRFTDNGATCIFAERATVDKDESTGEFVVTFNAGMSDAVIYVVMTHALDFTTSNSCDVYNTVAGYTATTTVTEKDPDKCTIDFSTLIFKVLTKTGDRSFNGAEFTASVDGWKVNQYDVMSMRVIKTHFVDLQPVTLKATFPANTTFDADGKAYRGFTGDTLTVTAGRYLFLIDEINDGQTNITYDESKYWLNLGFMENAEGKVSLAGQRVRKFVDGDTYETVLALEDREWMVVDTSISPVYFENTIDTGKDDYYPIIIPTIINKDTGMLNKTDHFAYVIGYPDGTVHPNGQITRAEVATIFFRLLRDEVRDGAFTTSNSYSDVAYGKWYNNPISTMSALGIITGYPDGTFKPNKPITRAEFAAIAARFDETQSGKSATFSDVIGHWAAKEIGIAYYNDWIKGYPDGTFKPDQNITRAEAMTLINRVLERKPESPADLLTNMNKWTDNMDTSKWYYLDVQEATNSHGYTRKTFNYELWRQMLPDPDWSRYER